MNYHPGYYRLRTIAAALGSSKNGTPQIELSVQPLAYLGVKGETGVNEEINGPPRTIYLSVTDGTMGVPEDPGWVWQTLLDLGFTGNDLSQLQSIVGHERNGELKYEMGDDGKERGKWGIFRISARGPERPANPGQVRDLNARFGNLLKSPRKEQVDAAIRKASQAAPGANGGQGQAKPPQTRQDAPRQPAYVPPARLLGMPVEDEIPF